MKRQEFYADIKDPFDRITAEQFQDRIFKAIDKGKPYITIDLKNLSYLDSVGIAAFVKILRRLSKLDGCLLLENVQSNVLRILKISALDKIVQPNVFKVIPLPVDADFYPSMKDKPLAKNVYRKLIVASDLSEISGFREKIKEIIMDIGLSERTSFDVLVAICEALNNSIEHGVTGPDYKITVQIAYALGVLDVEIKDKGCGFDFNAISRRGRGKFSTRGRGISLMQSLMDEVCFEHQPDGMTVKMTKKIGKIS